jgi:hypothetical protein
MLNLIQHCSRAPGLIWIDRDPEPPDRDNTEDVEEHQTQKSPQVIRLGALVFCRTWVSVVLDAACEAGTYGSTPVVFGQD